MISAYENKDKTQVVVVVNYSLSDKTIVVQWKGKAPAHWTPYCTSDKKNRDLMPLTKIKYGNEITIPARSVITYVGNK